MTEELVCLTAESAAASEKFAAALDAWDDLVAQTIDPEDDDAY